MTNKFAIYSKRLSRPKTWSTKARRVFTLTLLVSLPLWLLALIGIGAATLIRTLIRAAFQPLAAFWNDPPQKLRRSKYDYYPQSRSEKVVPIEAARDLRDDPRTGTHA